MISILFFSIIALFFVTNTVSAFRAPEEAPDLPEGWCNLAFGSPTRTTGECICKFECEGKGCKRDQGYIWYAYESCPTCQCVAPKTTGEKVDEPKVKAPPARKIHTPQPPPPGDFGSEEDPFILSEWLEDNANNIFAAVVTIFILLFTIPLIFFMVSPKGNAGSASTKSIKPSASETSTKKVESDKDK